MIAMHEGVQFRYLNEPIVRAMNLIGICSSQHKVDVWITSANDRQHGGPSRRSLHYSDLAIDVQTESVPPPSPSTRRLTGKALEDMRSLTAYLRSKLDDEGYDLIFETTAHWRHLHIEFEGANHLKTHRKEP